MGFANPIGFAFAALFVVLIALYLRERGQHHMDVPSLFLWRIVPEESRRSAPPRWNVLLTVQFIVLSLLVAALARPYWKERAFATTPTRHAYVLDVSASMQTREGATTRFQAAVAALEERLRLLPPDDEVMLVAAGDKPRVIAPFTRDHNRLLAELRGLRPLDTGTNLEFALALVGSLTARAAQPTQIEVFTDLPFPPDARCKRERVRWFRVGQTDNNIGLLGLQVLQSRFQDDRNARVKATIRNFSHRDGHGFLVVEIEGETVARIGFSLRPRATDDFVIGTLGRAGLVRASLYVDDALPADDVAYGWLSPSRAPTVLVVSPPSPFRADLESIARTTGKIRFQLVSPEEFVPGMETRADIALFHDFSPDTWPTRPSLHMYPPRGGRLFEVRGDTENAETLNWNERHPVLHGFPPILPRPFRHVRRIEPPAWADVLVTSQQNGAEVPLVLAGWRNQQRVGCTAFDPAQERLLDADNGPLLILFFNLLDWLLSDDEQVSVVRSGDLVTLTGLPPGAAVTDPQGRATAIPPGASDQTVIVEALHVGEHRVTGAAERRVLVNLFDPVESDTGRSGDLTEVSESMDVAPGTVVSRPTRTLTGRLLLLTVPLLLVEWIIWARRTTTRASR